LREHWAAEIKTQRKAAGDAAGDDHLAYVLVDADFEALMHIPTSWDLDAATVARIRAAAKTLLDESPAFQALLRELRTRPRP
jgi:hypothetical protein